MSDRDELGAVIEEWLGPTDAPPPERIARWFGRSGAFDAMLRARFGALIDRAIAGELDRHAVDPRGALAVVILLDQIARNVHRGTPRAFAGDARALSIARAAIARGDDARVPELHRMFFFMPLMHAEDLDAQEECVRRFEELARTCAPSSRAMLESALDFARQHRDIVARFRRFPHRNAILGRPSTDEERAFLEQPGSSF